MQPIQQNNNNNFMQPNIAGINQMLKNEVQKRKDLNTKGLIYGGVLGGVAFFASKHFKLSDTWTIVLTLIAAGGAYSYIVNGTILPLGGLGLE